MLEPCWNVLRYLEDLAGKWCRSSLMVMYLSWSSLSRERYPSGLSQTGYGTNSSAEPRRHPNLGRYKYIRDVPLRSL